MIKILILTDRPMRWYYMLLNMIDFDMVYNLKDRIELRNKLFYFLIKADMPENKRGGAYAHVILDKKIDEDTFYKILMPTIKQKLTHHGLDKILDN